MIEIISNSLGSCDWILIKKDGEVIHSGHEVSQYDLANILEQVTGTKTKVVEITDDQMELMS